MVITSDSFILLIPCEPTYIPEAEAVVAAVALFGSFVPEADEVHARNTERVKFIDAGENWEGVACPCCGTEWELAWWHEAMDRAWDKENEGFGDLTCTTPCCGATTSLNHLAYKWPVGFARFVLEARNPNRFDLDPGEITRLEELLGCRLRRIWAHL